MPVERLDVRDSLASNPGRVSRAHAHAPSLLHRPRQQRERAFFFHGFFEERLEHGDARARGFALRSELRRAVPRVRGGGGSVGAGFGLRFVRCASSLGRKVSSASRDVQSRRVVRREQSAKPTHVLQGSHLPGGIQRRLLRRQRSRGVEVPGLEIQSKRLVRAFGKRYQPQGFLERVRPDAPGATARKIVGVAGGCRGGRDRVVRAREEIRSRALGVVHDLLEVERVLFLVVFHGARAEGPARGGAAGDSAAGENSRQRPVSFGNSSDDCSKKVTRGVRVWRRSA